MPDPAAATDPQDPELLIPFSVDGETGLPAVEGVRPEVMAEWIMGSLGSTQPVWPSARVPKSVQQTFGPAEDVDVNLLSATGWAVLWAPDVTDEVKAALAPLLNLRRGEAGTLFQEVTLERQASGALETVQRFLERFDAGPGIIDPKNLPYYLLIVGSPATVPFEFQHALGVDYAVGRLHLPDAAAYGRYAAAAVAAESVRLPAKRLGIFGTTHPGDEATQKSSEQLVTPLINTFTLSGANWQVESCLGATATRDRLKGLLSGQERVSILFTATHGVEFKKDQARQVGEQGGIVCQGWTLGTQVPPKHLLGAADLDPSASYQGLVWMSFACFSAGTPAEDNYPGNPNLMTPGVLADAPFQAALPTALLGHAGGPALGFIGHVERAWPHSFIFGTATHQYLDFAECLRRLLVKGRRLGHARRVLGERYASLSAQLAVEMISLLRAKTPLTRTSAKLLTRLWMGSMDARNFVLLGDPAARQRYAA